MAFIDAVKQGRVACPLAYARNETSIVLHAALSSVCTVGGPWYEVYLFNVAVWDPFELALPTICYWGDFQFFRYFTVISRHFCHVVDGTALA